MFQNIFSFNILKLYFYSGLCGLLSDFFWKNMVVVKSETTWSLPTSPSFHLPRKKSSSIDNVDLNKFSASLYIVLFFSNILISYDLRFSIFLITQMYIKWCLWNNPIFWLLSLRNMCDLNMGQLWSLYLSSSVIDLFIYLFLFHHCEALKPFLCAVIWTFNCT